MVKALVYHLLGAEFKCFFFSFLFADCKKKQERHMYNTRCDINNCSRSPQHQSLHQSVVGVTNILCDYKPEERNNKTVRIVRRNIITLSECANNL